MSARRRVTRRHYEALPVGTLIRLAAHAAVSPPESRRKRAAKRQTAAVLAHRLAAEAVAQFWPSSSVNAAACALAAVLQGGECPAEAVALVTALQIVRQKAGLTSAPSAAQIRRDLLRTQ